jgi:hypothetical protein
MSKNKSTSRRWLILLGWLTGGAFLTAALRQVRFVAVIEILSRLTLPAIFLLLVVNILIMFSLSLRWWSIFRRFELGVPFWRLSIYRLVSFGVSYFTPGPHLGGEPLQVLLLTRTHQVPVATGAASVTLEKAVEIMINFGFLGIGLLVVLVSDIIPSIGLIEVLPLLALNAIPLLYLWAIMKRKTPLTALLAGLPPQISKRPLLDRFMGAVRSTEQEIVFYCQTNAIGLWEATAISLINWGLLIGEYGLAFALLGQRLAPVQIIAMIVAGRIAYLLPSPGGLGTLEASQVWMSARVGLDPAYGLSISLLIRVRDVLFGLVGLGIGAIILGNRQEQV